MPWASRLCCERRGEGEPLLLVNGFAISSAVFEPVPDLYAAPALVIHGERDQRVPIRNAHTLVQRIPGAELAVVPGAGHAYALERPREGRDLLLSWMSRTREEPHVAAHR